MAEGPPLVFFAMSSTACVDELIYDMMIDIQETRLAAIPSYWES
jgi:hypothetical protein